MSTPLLRAVVIGAGYAGTRLLAALRHLQLASAVEVVGVVDRDAARLEVFRQENFETSTSVDEALAAIDPEVVVVAVNEDEHMSVLRSVADSGPRSILCEKPLAPTIAECEELKSTLSHCRFSMNLVERFSDVVTEAATWLRETGEFETLRVEFQWGKHRIGDPRPTIGITSEIIHPLDLARVLFGVERLDQVAGCATSSPLRPDAEPTRDWLSFAAVADGSFPLTGSVSFSWPRRVRTMTALVRSADDALYRLLMSFDTPHWDCDQLIVERIDPFSGRYQTVHAHNTALDDIDESVRGINKVARFVEESFSAWSGSPVDVPLVDVEEAIALQRLVDMACESIVPFRVGAPLLRAGR